MKQTLFFALGIIVALSIATITNKLQSDPCTIKKSYAEAEFIDGFYVFIDSKPVKDFEFLGALNGAGAGLGAMMNPQYQNVRNAILKKARKEYPKGNGVILHLNAAGKDKADVILIKE